MDDASIQKKHLAKRTTRIERLCNEQLPGASDRIFVDHRIFDGDAVFWSRGNCDLFSSGAHRGVLAIRQRSRTYVFEEVAARYAVFFASRVYGQKNVTATRDDQLRDAGCHFLVSHGILDGDAGVRSRRTGGVPPGDHQRHGVLAAESGQQKIGLNFP